MIPGRHTSPRLLPLAALLALLILPLASCRRERKIDQSNLDARTLPTMRTVNVNTLISDSGIVQYRIVSPLWFVYEQADTPYWRFPDGLYLRRLDPYGNVIATVAADSAIYYKNQRLWRLDGRVEITRVPKDLFQTEQLFWDERRHLLYTSRFIHIENATHMLEGDGFRSDDRLSKYTIVKPKGIFPLNPASAAMPGVPAGAPASAGAVGQTVFRQVPMDQAPRTTQ